MCKILKNTKLKKLIIVFLIILLLINMFPEKVQAAGFLETAGGVMLETILEFLIFLSDTVLNILQNNFISTEKVVVQAQSGEMAGISLKDVLFIAIGIIIIIVSIVIAIVSWGSLSWVSVGGVMASIKFLGGVVLFTALGTVSAVHGTSNLIETLSGKFDLPLIRFTPYEIFSNQIPVFDINFIKPSDTFYDEHVYNFDIGTGENDAQSNANTKWGDILKNASTNGINLKYFEEIGVLTDSGLPGYDDLKNKEIKESPGGKYNGYTLEGDFGLTRDVYNHAKGVIIADGHDFDSWSKARYMRYNDFTETEKQNYVSALKHYQGNDNEYNITLFWIHDGDIYAFEGVDVDGTNNKTYVYKLPFNEKNNDNVYKKVNETTGKIQTHVVVKQYQSSASILQKSISTWYKVLRRVALVGLLSVLVYVGIRIITSSPSGKSKYKSMFLNWLVAVCILFVLHYLMVLILTVSSKITEIFIAKGEPNIIVDLPVDTSIDGVGLPGGESATDQPETATEDNPPVWSCSFTGYLRLVAGAYGEKDSIGLTNFAYAIMYVVMVIYTCIFTIMYLKRVLYMAFLTMIAPLIALTYPLDKLKDGKAQAFGLWFREYMFNALIQPIHLILYIMIVSNVMDYVTDHPVYAVVALGFLLPAEKFIRKLFGFDKQSTAGDDVANMVGGAAVMGGVNKLSALNRERTPHEEIGDGKVRTADNPPENIEVPRVEQTAEPQENPDVRTQIRNALTQLQSQGLSRDEIRQSLINQFGNPSLVDEVMSQGGTGNQGGATQQNGNNNNQGSNLRVPQITPATQRNNTRGFGSRVASGFLNVGYEARKRNLTAKPLKTIGRFTGMAFGGAALGLVGLAAGISTGDMGNTLKFTGSGILLGSNVGGTLGANIGEWTSEQKEAFRQGYLGSEEYGNMQFDRKFLASEELRDLINNRDIHSEMSGNLTSEVKRTRAIAREAHEYHTAGVTDTEQIKACMRAGLTSQEGLYAIELAKSMKKENINTPQKVINYKARYKAAFAAQNTSQAHTQKINDIWEVATKIRFK